MSQTIRYNADTDDLAVRPHLSTDQIKDLLLNLFGLEIDPEWERKEFNSYDDRNFYVEGTLQERGNVFDEKYQHCTKFVLKVFNVTFSSKRDWYENVNKSMHLCSSKCGGFKVPLPLCGVYDTNRMAVFCELPLLQDAVLLDSKLTLDEIVSKNEFIRRRDDGIYYVKHMARLSVYIPGVLVSLKSINNNQLFNFGEAVATLDLGLKEIEAPEVDLQKSLVWNVLHIITNDFHNPYVNTLVDEDKKKMCEDILAEFSAGILPKLKTLPKQWINSDCNEQNVLFYGESGSTDRVAGLIDFDDLIYSYTVIELGTSLMYVSAVEDLERCMENAKLFYKGYCSVSKLTDVELDCVFGIMLVRYVQSCCIGLYQYNFVDPGNEYLLVTNTGGWKAMKYFCAMGKEKFLKRLEE